MMKKPTKNNLKFIRVQDSLNLGHKNLQQNYLSYQQELKSIQMKKEENLDLIKI